MVTAEVYRRFDVNKLLFYIYFFIISTTEFSLYSVVISPHDSQFSYIPGSTDKGNKI